MTACPAGHVATTERQTWVSNRGPRWLTDGPHARRLMVTRGRAALTATLLAGYEYSVMQSDRGDHTPLTIALAPTIGDELGSRTRNLDALDAYLERALGRRVRIVVEPSY